MKGIVIVTGPHGDSTVTCIEQIWVTSAVRNPRVEPGILDAAILRTVVGMRRHLFARRAPSTTEPGSWGSTLR